MVLGPTSEALQCGVKSVLHSDLRLIHVIRLPTVLSDRLSALQNMQSPTMLFPVMLERDILGYVGTRTYTQKLLVLGV